VQECRSAGVQEFRSSGVQECRSAGVQEFRSSGVQEARKLLHLFRSPKSGAELQAVQSGNITKRLPTEVCRFILQLLNS